MASGFYEGVFEKKDERMNLPRVLKHYQLKKSNASNFETIITLQNGDDFFGFGKHNDCRIYLFASPMEEEAGNFNKHALFVPTFYKICFGAVKMQPLFYTVSSNVMVTIKKDDLMGEQPPHIKQINGKTDIIPEFKTVNNSLMLFTRGQVSEPGFYEVNYGGKSLLPLAFNNWRRESALESYTMSELTEILEKIELKNITLIDDTESDISGQVLETEGGKKLWKLFILLALGFILAETALLRFLK